MELPLPSSAMTLFLSHLLVFCSEVGYTLVPDADQVAPALKVSHLDCSSMTENSVYAINQVRPCHITPEELEVSKATITLYTKHFPKELNATKCRIQHQREKLHCGHNDHSSIDHTIAGITSDLIISPELCHWFLWRNKEQIIISSGDQIQQLNFYSKLKTNLKNTAESLGTFTLCSNHQWRLRLEIWKEYWKGTEWCYSALTVYSTQ